jgi:hypothetical protein
LNCDTSGNAKGAIQQTSGGSNSEIPNSMTVDSWGNISISGYFDSDPIVFGPSVMSNTANGFDIFVARMGGILTGIPSVNDIKNVVLYPNPTNEYLFLKSNIPLDAIEIFNLSGENVYSQTNLSSHLYPKVNVSSFSSGIYFVKLTQRDNQICKKLIIKNN